MSTMIILIEDEIFVIRSVDRSIDRFSEIYFVRLFCSRTLLSCSFKSSGTVVGGV